MIRFTCTTCGRAYQLPDALARMPLLCKGCGQRLVLPEPTPDPEPEPFAEAPPGHPFISPAMPGTVDLFPDTDVPRKRALDSKGELDPQDTVDLFPVLGVEPSNAAVVTEKLVPHEKRERVVAGKTHFPAWRGRAMQLVVDVVVGLTLAGVGALLGELATRKGTVEILREAGGAPKFPTIDLLVWLGCVATPVMGYVLFANRGKSVGGWFRRRLLER